MFYYLRSSCDIGCRLSGLKCGCVSKKIPMTPFIRNFVEVMSLHACNIIHDVIEVMWPNAVIFGTKHLGVPIKSGYHQNFNDISIFNSWHFPVLTLSCPHDINFLELKYSQVQFLINFLYYYSHWFPNTWKRIFMDNSYFFYFPSLLCTFIFIFVHLHR